jgi:hypothetical protein
MVIQDFEHAGFCCLDKKQVGSFSNEGDVVA